MTLGDVDLPAFVEPDTELVDQHRQARLETKARLDDLVGVANDLFRFHGRRRLVEALANLFLDDRPAVLPPRRRHLHPVLERRLGGVYTAFRHVDARLEMIRLDHINEVVSPETPFVLNAFAESHDPNSKDTNAGLIRFTDSGFDATQSDFMPPSGDRCAELLQRCVQTVNEVDAPAVARAGWLCASFLAVHPFVDGNGRTARLLFQLVASSDPDERFDWGSVEQWAIRRSEYIAVLKQTQAPSMPHYRGDRVDVGPFIDFAVRCGVDGAALVGRRAEWFARAIEHLGERDPALQIAEVAVVASSSLSLAELEELLDSVSATDAAGQLVAEGRLAWDRRGLLRPTVRNELLAITT